jgi:hypothetical protein
MKAASREAGQNALLCVQKLGRLSDLGCRQDTSSQMML